MSRNYNRRYQNKELQLQKLSQSIDVTTMKYYQDEELIKENIQIIGIIDDYQIKMGKTYYRQPFEQFQINKIKALQDKESEELITLTNEEVLSVSLFQNTPSFVRVNIEGQFFPMKLKAKSFFGQIQINFSYKNPKPLDFNADYVFHIVGEKNFLIQKSGKIQTKFVFMSIYSENNSKCELKVWFQKTLNEKQQQQFNEKMVRDKKIKEEIELLKQRKVQFDSFHQRDLMTRSIDYETLNKQAASRIYEDRKSLAELEISKIRKCQQVKEKKDYDEAKVRWHKLILKEAKCQKMKYQQEQNFKNMKVKPKQRRWIQTIQIVFIFKEMRDRLLRFKISGWLKGKGNEYPKRIFQWYMRQIQYRSIPLDCRVKRDIKLCLFYRVRYVKRKMKIRVNHMVGLFFKDSKPALQLFNMELRAFKVLQSIIKLQKIYKYQLKTEIEAVYLMLNSVISSIKNEEGLENVDQKTIPKNKRSYYIPVLTPAMKREIVLEYLHEIKLNFQKNFQRFANLNLLIVNLIRDKKKSPNQAPLFDNSSETMLANLRAELAAIKGKAKQKPSTPPQQKKQLPIEKDPPLNSKKQESTRPQYGIYKRRDLLRDLLIIQLDKLRLGL